MLPLDWLLNFEKQTFVYWYIYENIKHDFVVQNCYRVIQHFILFIYNFEFNFIGIC